MDELKRALKNELERAVPAHFGEVFNKQDGEQMVDQLLDDVEYIAAVQRDFTRELEAKQLKDTLENRMLEFEQKLQDVTKRVGRAKNNLSHSKNADLQELVYHRSKIITRSTAQSFGMKTAGPALNPRRLINVEQFEQGEATKDVIVGVRTAMKMRHGAELGAIRSAHEQDSLQLQKKLRRAQGELAELKRRQAEQLSTLQLRLREAITAKNKGSSPGSPVKGEGSAFCMDIPGSDRGLCSPQGGDDDASDGEEKAILQAAGKQVDIATKEQKWGWNFVEQLSSNSFPSKQNRWNGCTKKALRMEKGEQYMDTHLVGSDYKDWRPATQGSQQLQNSSGRSGDMAQTWPQPGPQGADAVGSGSPSGLFSQTAPAGVKPPLGVTGVSSPAASVMTTLERATGAMVASSPTHIEGPVPPPSESSGLPRLPGASPPEVQRSPEPVLPLDTVRPSTSGSTGSPLNADKSPNSPMDAPDGHGPEVTTQPANLAGMTIQPLSGTGGQKHGEEMARVGSPPRSRKGTRRRPKGQLMDVQTARQHVAALGQFALPPAYEAYASKRMMKALDV